MTSTQRLDRSDAADPRALALAALGWIVSEEDRAIRLLDLTGLDPDGLRSGVHEDAVLAAVLEFLANHEPDLLRAAEALAVAPEDLIAAKGALGA